MAFLLFKFIKDLTPKFSHITPKNDGVFKVQFHNTNLALKMPKWATKMLHLATYSSNKTNYSVQDILS